MITFIIGQTIKINMIRVRHKTVRRQERQHL